MSARPYRGNWYPSDRQSEAERLTIIADEAQRGIKWPSDDEWQSVAKGFLALQAQVEQGARREAALRKKVSLLIADLMLALDEQAPTEEGTP